MFGTARCLSGLTHNNKQQEAQLSQKDCAMFVSLNISLRSLKVI